MTERPGTDLTLHEAADRLGVHYMTAYRYVRLGLLPAAKVGGTWRVAGDDFEAFHSGASGARGEAGRGASSNRRRAPWADRLEQRLMAGDGRGSWGVIEAALAAGAGLEEIYLEVLAPAMTSIGARWERGEIDVAIEHRASGIAMRLIGRVGHRFARRGRSRGSVVIGAPTGERHSLPVAMVSDLLRRSGWEVSDLGADTPPSSFALAASELSDMVAVGVSITTPANLAAGAEALAAVRAVVAPEVWLFVGGQAVRDLEHARELGADHCAPDGRSLTELLDTLAAGGGAEDEGGTALDGVVGA